MVEMCAGFVKVEIVAKIYIFLRKGIGCSLAQISVPAIDKTNNSEGLVQWHAQACSSYERIVSQLEWSESASQQGRGFGRDIWESRFNSPHVPRFRRRFLSSGIRHCLVC
jgi:hypothetical protein